MKTILVPTDFSKASQDAIRYAAELQKKFGSKLICYHAISNSYLRERNLDDFANHVKSFVQANTSLETAEITECIAKEGDLFDVTESLLNERNISIIVMGTKGAKGLKKLFVGSNTVGVLSNFFTPLLIIPEGYKFKNIDIIMWASDFKAVYNDNCLDIPIQIAKRFDSEVRITHVKTSSKRSSFEENLERSRENYLLGEDIKHSFKRVHRSSISKGLRYYMSLKDDNDLLLMVKREHGVLDKFFGKDHAEVFASNPKIPMLIVHE